MYTCQLFLASAADLFALRHIIYVTLLQDDARSRGEVADPVQIVKHLSTMPEAMKLAVEVRAQYD